MIKCIFKLWMCCFIFGMIVSGLYLIYTLYTIHAIESAFPSFEMNVQRYHTTEEILYDTMNNNELNPFYSYFDLSPEIEDDRRLKIIGYGPIEPPLDIPIRVMVVCGQHGRERISPEICYNLIRLIQRNIFDEVLTDHTERVTLNKIGIWVVPIANPWARMYVETHPEDGQCRRTNVNGVDLNRNFPVIPISTTSLLAETMYSNQEVYSDNEMGRSEMYPGPNPLSEYESLAIADFLAEVQPHVLINVHSGGNDILLPYDTETSNGSRPPHYNIMVKLANYARKSTCPTCKLGISSMILYPALGTLMDYALYFRGVQLGYTLEIYASSEVKNDHYLDSSECKKFFNPSEGKEYYDTVKRWLTFILSLINRIPSELSSF